MMLVTFTIPGQPQGKGRARVGKIGGHARLFTPAKTVAYEGLVAHAASQALGAGQRFEGAVGCNVFLHCEVPASWSGKKRGRALAGEIMPTTKPDADNVVKAVFDGCNGVLWRDDVLVVDLRVQKRYSAQPCVRVEVWSVEAPLGMIAMVPAAQLLPAEPAQVAG